MPTPKQLAMYQFIRQFFARHGKAPTLQEIAYGLGTRSRGVVHRTLQKLASYGYIFIEPGKKRGIKLNYGMNVPSSLVPIAGHIMAGTPTQPVEKQAMLDVSELLINENLQVLQIVGECEYLSEFSINPGDYVICEQSNDVPEDKLAVVIIKNSDFMICYVSENADGEFMLKTEANRELCLPKDDVEIKGIYTGLIRLNESS